MRIKSIGSSGRDLCKPEMKKLFSRFERIDQGAAREANNFVGKVFTVGRTTVTVEDVIAEGECFLQHPWHPPWLPSRPLAERPWPLEPLQVSPLGASPPSPDRTRPDRRRFSSSQLPAASLSECKRSVIAGENGG